MDVVAGDRDVGGRSAGVRGSGGGGGGVGHGGAARLGEVDVDVDLFVGAEGVADAVGGAVEVVAEAVWEGGLVFVV